ncbi:hypothetical protein EDB80DRAFT_875637 [Ilyonectria destructans]|nr:hypothetical protein EDB80DRAFT_875637 [Ilyonectria destructans]
MSIFAVVFIFIYYVFYGLSLLSIPYMYPAEINSQRMRNVGTSIATAVNWSFVYVVVTITPIAIENIQWEVLHDLTLSSTSASFRSSGGTMLKQLISLWSKSTASSRSNTRAEGHELGSSD